MTRTREENADDLRREEEHRKSVQEQVKAYINLEPGSEIDLKEFPDFGTEEFVEEYLEQSGKYDEEDHQS